MSKDDRLNALISTRDAALCKFYGKFIVKYFRPNIRFVINGCKGPYIYRSKIRGLKDPCKHPKEELWRVARGG